jgi:hypothetical protein
VVAAVLLKREMTGLVIRAAMAVLVHPVQLLVRRFHTLAVAVAARPVLVARAAAAWVAREEQ